MTLPYYPFYWGDYSKKAMHLTQGQHGAYLLFLRYIYTTHQPVPDATRYGVAQAFTKPERDNADFVLNSFFVPGDGCWRSPKAEEVIAKADAAHGNRTRAGRLGGTAKASKARATPEQHPSNATAGLQQCPSNALATTELSTYQEESWFNDGQESTAAGAARA